VNRFWDLFAESVIVQGLLTATIWVVIMALVLMGRDVPEMLVNVGYTIIGFWFGTKVQSAVNKVARYG